MSDPIIRRRSLSEIADTNPETFSLADANATMRYIDLSAVTDGLIDWNKVPELSVLSAPSRARRIVRKGDVLFGTVRPNLRSHGYIDSMRWNPLVASTGFSVVRAKEGLSNARYLFHCILSEQVRQQANRDAVGSSYPAVNDSEVRNFQLFAPSVDAQAMIARVLDTLDTTIRQTEAIIAKLKQVKQGLLHDLLTLGIDANGELRPPQSQAPHLYKQSPLGWIPREWDVAPLLSRIDLPQGQVDPRLPPYVDWVLVAPDHIESSTGRLLAAVTARDQGAISGKYLCNPGDVIYSKIRPYLRKATLATDNVLCSADMYPFTPHMEVNSRFLLSLLLGERFSRFAESVSMRTGMPKINREELAECMVAWPSRSEQDSVVEVLGAADREHDLFVGEREKLAELKAGLMDDLLTGRVRVTPLLEAGTT